MSDPAAPRRYGVVPPAEARTMSGLELLRGWCEGRFPSPPIGRFMQGDLAEVERGRVVFEGTPGEMHYNPLGIVHGGYAATLLDSCMGCAVHSTLAAGQGYTTVEVKVNYVRAMTDRTGKVRAEGKVVHAGSRIATAEGRLTDADGRLLAHGTTTCLIFAV
jgi:uncharacterized protein (TIGR00369 family)